MNHVGFERIRVLKHLFGNSNTELDRGLENAESLQAQVEMRATLRAIHEHEMSDLQLTQAPYAVIDTETTGFEVQQDRLLSLAAVLFDQTASVREFHTFVKLRQGDEIPQVVRDLTGITEEVLRDAPPLELALQAFLQFIGDRVIVAHHAGHDVKFINAALRRHFAIELQQHIIDTGKVSLCVHDLKKYPSLDALLELYEIPVTERHTALGDARMTACVWARQIHLLQALGVSTFGPLWERLYVLERRVHEQPMS